MPWPSVAGEDEAAAGGQLSDQLLGDSDPVQAGHLQIRHGHVRAVPAGHREGLVAGGGLGHDLQVFLDRQQGGQRSADEVLVVGEEHADHGAGVSPRRASCAASSLWTAIRDRFRPSTSCRSRAKRSRSSATGRRACAVRDRSSSDMIRSVHADARQVSTPMPTMKA